jgi:predicted PurR-regulated permease PerM
VAVETEQLSNFNNFTFMENTTSKIPAYIKLSQITVGILAFFYIVYIGQDILIPLVFSLIVSILLNPVVNYFSAKGMNRIFAIFLSVILMLLFIGGVLYFIGSQLTLFSDALPQLKAKFNSLTSDSISWVSESLNVSKWKVTAWMASKKVETMSKAGSMIGGALSTISSFFILVFLIPIYIFMFLFYKPLLLDFVSQVFTKDKHHTVADVLVNTKSLIQSYLVGLLIEMVIVATLNSTALLIIGVDYAILLGAIGAILNLIPYIGGIIAISLPMLMALITQTPMTALFVLLGYVIVQLIDNNFLVPKIVASKVKVNALISIVVVLIGGALWGVAGMFLSIPVTAIFKVIFDKTKPLQPLGFLIGDTMPQIGEGLLTIHLLRSNKEIMIQNKKEKDEKKAEKEAIKEEKEAIKEEKKDKAKDK